MRLFKRRKHEPTVVRGTTRRMVGGDMREFPSGFQMECSCGWTSAMVPTAQRAKSAWFKHEMETA